MTRNRALLYLGIGLAVLGLVACLTLLFTGCGRPNLAPGLSGWYEKHRLLMDQKLLPYCGQGGMTEGKYFLSLPPEKQSLYAQHFWEFRLGKKEVFDLRYAFAVKMYPHAVVSVPVQILAICGWPEDTSIFDIAGNYSGGGLANDTHLLEPCLVVWRYFRDNGYPILFGWGVSHGDWRQEALDVAQYHEAWKFFIECLSEYAVTMTGWDAWQELNQ